MRREAKLVGAFALALGISALAISANLLLGGETQSGGLSCKSICGLSLLVTQFLGASTGGLVGSLLWLLVGIVFTFVGYRVFSGR
jgi:hypothetical protein